LEASRARSAGVSISTNDAGTLDWPLEGRLIYRFGLERRPNGTTLRWNGIGLAAPPGTPVRAVRGGQVIFAGPFEGYGPIVILHHGGGFYTHYMYLEEIGVVEGREVEAGQVVGTVGGSDTPEGPHIEFQIRAPVDGDLPRAQDPLEWLRPQAGG
jgi:septal ring factor EnvC (AmiA/AmiB activator)